MLLALQLLNEVISVSNVVHLVVVFLVMIVLK